MQLIKKLLTSLFLVGTLAINCTAFASDDSGLQELNSIVARVNSDIITQTELDEAFHVAWDQQQAAQANGMPAVTADQLKQIVLEQLITQKMQLQVAEQNKITISDKQLNDTIANIAKQHHTSVSKLYQKVKQSGLSKAEYRKQIRDQIIIMTLHRGIVGDKANVSQSEIEDYKKMHSDYVYQVGDIVIESSDDAAEKAKAAKKELANGADYHTVADQYAPNNNHVLSWRPLAGLPDLFANVLENTKVNQPAGPVQAPNGLHVLYLLGKKNNPRALTENQIRMMLYQQKSEKIIKPWIKQLQDSSQIKIMDGNS